MISHYRLGGGVQYGGAGFRGFHDAFSCVCFLADQGVKKIAAGWLACGGECLLYFACLGITWTSMSNLRPARRSEYRSGSVHGKPYRSPLSVQFGCLTREHLKIPYWLKNCVRLSKSTGFCKPFLPRILSLNNAMHTFSGTGEKNFFLPRLY
ncbi:MAG: hypothetical protein HYV27_10060 [Candidatus Hydrogenedentes bacterium]|nr:hypothetical protein [Candidatus Hydrogenedentota bacterium]